MGLSTNVVEVTPAAAVVVRLWRLSRTLSGLGNQDSVLLVSGASQNARDPTRGRFARPTRDDETSRSRISGPMAIPRKKVIDRVFPRYSFATEFSAVTRRTNGMIAAILAQR